MDTFGVVTMGNIKAAADEEKIHVIQKFIQSNSL